MNDDHVLRYTCPKCGNKQYSVGEMYTSGNFWERIFEFQYRKFTYVSCEKCHFTELFKIPKKMIGEVFNLPAR